MLPLLQTDEIDEEDEQEMGILEMLAIDQNEVGRLTGVFILFDLCICMHVCTLYVYFSYCFYNLQLPGPIRSISQEVQGASQRLKTVIRNEVRLPL